MPAGNAVSMRPCPLAMRLKCSSMTNTSVVGSPASATRCTCLFMPALLCIGCLISCRGLDRSIFYFDGKQLTLTMQGDGIFAHHFEDQPLIDAGHRKLVKARLQLYLPGSVLRHMLP